MESKESETFEPSSDNEMSRAPRKRRRNEFHIEDKEEVGLPPKMQSYCNRKRKFIP